MTSSLAGAAPVAVIPATALAMPKDDPLVEVGGEMGTAEAVDTALAAPLPKRHEPIGHLSR